MLQTNEKKVNLNLALIAFIATCIVFFILWFHGCSNSQPKQNAIVIPEKKEKFEAVKPRQQPIHDTIEVPKYIGTNDKEVYLKQISELSKENKALQEFFNTASDSLKKVKYADAIELKSFSHTFENDKYKATASGIVRGEIQSIGLEYTQKEFKIELPKPKETYLRFLIGGGMGLNKEMNQLGFKLNAGFQNRKGNVIRWGFEKIGNKQFYFAEFDISVLNLKR